MKRALPCLAVPAVILGLAVSALAQEAVVSDPIIIAPQAREVIILPHPRPPRPPHMPVSLPVAVTSVSASVAIDDQLAATTLVMTLHNPGRAPQEAQVMVPVPDGATVRSFGVDGLGGSEEPNAKLLPRDEARRIYESIVRRSRDPGLLEFVGMGAIRSSVFPVPAGGTQTVRLTYESLLVAERGMGESAGDRVDYILPRSDSTPSAGGGPGVSWTLALDLRAKRPISTVYSPSHEIVTERIDQRHVRIHAASGSGVAPGSFRLSYLLQPKKEGITATVFAYPDPEIAGGQGGYFMLLAGLPSRPANEAAATKREITIVLDRSGSMRGEKIKQVREAALQVIEGLHDGERFNIIDYSDSINTFADHSVVKSDQTMGTARKYIEGIQANGGTNIHDALLEALRQPAPANMLPVVLFLTDGLPTVGQTSESAIRDASRKANSSERRIFTFGVGYDVNAPLLTGLAKDTRGSGTFVLPEEDVEVKVGAVFRKLSGPAMAAPKLAVATGADEPSGCIREMLPAELPDLFDGDQLVVLGQYTSSQPVTFHLSGACLGKDMTFEVPFDPARASARNAYVGRLWASRKIASLLEQIRLAGADAISSAPADPRLKELVDEIVRLSTKWGIMTEYTAFLAVEPGSELARRDEQFAPVAPAEAPAKAMDNIRGRAEHERAGKGAVSQELNLQAAQSPAPAQYGAFYDKDMKKTQVTSVQQLQDRALFKRQNRWVDARLLDREDQPPELTVEFASPEYFQLVDELAAQNRQALLAQDGDVYLVHNGKRVLVTGQ